MKRIAIITARGGSKRIPKKNIKEFCGKPIIAYSIMAALSSKIFDEVMVSTDSEEIAKISESYGASVPFMRSEFTSGDYATTTDVIMEVLNHYKELEKEFDTTVCIYPTAPFVTVKKLKAGIELLENGGYAEVMPVVRFSYPPQRGYIQDNDTITMKYPQFRNTRSQDLEPIYHDAGQFYCFNTKYFIEHEGQITENIAPIIVSETEVQDIDNEDDWKIAELKYNFLIK